MEENLNLNKNNEIDELLKEFEIKNSAELPKEKEEIQVNLNESSKMVNWVIETSHGKIKTRKQAEILLLIVSIFFIVISIFLFFRKSTVGTPKDIKILPARY